MSVLINNSKLFLFFMFIFLSFLFLFNISGMSKNQQTSGIISHHLDWIQSLNKDIPALANRSNSLRVADSFQQGNLLAVNLTGFQDYQGGERKIDKIIAIDLSTRQILYEKVFYDTKTFIGLYENYLIYSYNENDKKSVDDYKLKIIDLTKENREKEFKGTLDQIAENGYIVCRFPGHLIDIKNGEIVFSHEYLKDYSSPLTTSGFFIKRKNDKGNWDSYQFINYHGEVVFSLPDTNKTYLPRNETNSTLFFPIPILKEGDNEENIIQFIDDSGQVIDTYPLSEMGIPGTAFGRNHLPYGHLKILAKYEQKYILEVEVSTEEEKGKEYILWFDGQQNKVSILEEDIRVMADFNATGHLMMLVESESRYGHFILKYYDPQGNCLWEKYLPPDIDGWVEIYPINEESVLLYDDHESFFRYSLIDGQLTGLYPFPIDYSIQLATVFDNQAYVLTGQRYNNDTELKGNHLISFSLGNTGWFDFELVKVSPLAGQPLTVYEDRKIDLEFQSGQYDLAEEQLEINFDKGEFLDKSSGYGGRWDCQWQSPELIDKDEETVNITATYGPISKNYQVVVKNLENPLILTGELKVDSRDQYQLILEGNIKNTAYLDIKDLDWQWELNNLNEIYSSFPKNIPAQGERSFKMRLNRLAISEDQWEKIDWDGYKIFQEVKLSCNYPGGSCEQVFSHLLQIEPTYSISLRLFDPSSKHYWGRKDLEKLDLSKFSIWDDQNNNITANFQIRKNVLKNGISIQNIAPGITEKPTKLEVRYPGSSKWLELYFQQDKHPKFPKIAVENFDYSLPVAGSFLVKIIDHDNQDVLKDVTVTLVKKDENSEYQDLEEKQTDDEGACYFEALSPGEYHIETSKEGYIPNNIKLPGGNYQEEIYDLAQGEQKVLQLEMHPYTSVVFYAESYYESFYKDKSKVKLLKSIGLTEASDHIFIIPEGAEYVFLQFLYKIGYPEDAAAFGFFAEDEYKVELDIMDENSSMIVMADYAKGEGIKEIKEEDIYIRGDQSSQDFGEHVLKVNEINKPTSFDFKMRTSVDNDWQESTFWLFPSEWMDYKDEAKQLALLYPLANHLDMFDYPEKAIDYLKSVQIDMFEALSPILSYGADALKIFGEIPDPDLKTYLKDKTEDFILGKIEKAVELAVGTTCATVFSEVLSIIQTIHSAEEWGGRAKDVTEEGKARVHSEDCLKVLSDRDNLQDAKELLEVFKSMVQDLIPLVENNDCEGCQTIIQNMRTIILGNNINSDNPADYKIDSSQFDMDISSNYCLLFTLCMEYTQIINDWENNYAPCFPDSSTLSADKLEGNEALEIDKKKTTQEAMKIYKPIIENILQITSIPVNALLIEND